MQRVIEAISLFLLIAVTILRPLVPETYDSAESAITAALGPLSDPSPVRTLIFDLLILLGACGWLLSRAVGSARHYRVTGLEIGAAIVVLASVISCLAAGNKRLAINASLDWLCFIVLAIALAQLMYRPWHRRLLLAAVLASACVQATQCFDQYFMSFDDTWEHYQIIKAEFWAAQGVEPDAPKVELFERRMQAHEASGFLPHSNIAGSYLVLCGLAALGLVWAKWKRASDGVDRLLAVGATVGAVAILLAVLLTKSLGAIASAAAGFVLWIVLRLSAKWLQAHRRKAFAIGWAVAVAGLLAVVGHGLYHGSFPHMSLTFRWQYWLASYDMIGDHALAGVGRENFGRHYLQYKSIDSPEEIANPHNLLVQAASDWGLLGLIGITVMLVGASLALTSEPRALARANSRAPNGPRAFLPTRRDRDADTRIQSPRAIPWIVSLVLVVTAVRWPLLGTDDPNYLYYATVTTGIVWLGAFICFAAVRSLTVASRSDDPSVACVVMVEGIAVGLFALVLHDMINFAMFVPATATTAFALLACGIAEKYPPEPRASARANSREPNEPRAHEDASSTLARADLRNQTEGSHNHSKLGRTSRWLPLAAMLGITATVALFVVRPVVLASRELARTRGATGYRQAVSTTDQAVYRHFQRAADYDPLDPTPYVECARWLLTTAMFAEARDETLPLVAECLEQAVKRDPFNVRHPRMQMQLYKTWAGHSGDAAHYLAAADAAKAALRLYPQDPVGIAALADCQVEAGISTGSRDLLRDAIDSYKRALALDHARPPWGQIRRFRDRQRVAIHAKIKRATDMLTQTP